MTQPIIPIESFLKEKIRNFSFSPGSPTFEKQLHGIIYCPELFDYPEIRHEFENMLEVFKKFSKEQKVANSLQHLQFKLHLEAFGKMYFNQGTSFRYEPYTKIPLAKSLVTELGIDPHWCFTSDAGICGGVARSILKKILDVSLEGELPFGDIDLVILQKSIGRYEKSINISDTKILPGVDIEQEVLTSIFYETDVTMNQVMIHNGNIYFSEKAADDIVNRLIRGNGKKCSGIFEEESTMYQHTPYFFRSGLYRAFAFLLAEKGDGIVTSYENLIQEGGIMGRYWIILLAVKLMKIADPLKQELAIHNWYYLAWECKATTAGSPRDFLKELVELFPEMKRYLKGEVMEKQNPSKQMGWIANRFLNSFMNKYIFPKEYIFPKNTSEIVRRRPFNNLEDINRNLNSFWKEIELIQKDY